MNSKILCVTTFAIGAAVGSVATWYCLKTKYEQIAQEEIDSVKEMFKDREQNNGWADWKPESPASFTKMHQVEMIEPNKRKEFLKEANDIAKQNDYTSHFTTDDEEEENMNEPYVIPPEEFGDYGDYEQISLTLYADGVLADEDDNVVEDIAGTVGPYYEDHFGEYEDDSVYVRNDVTRCEYEILKVEDRYSDATSQKYSMVANRDFD